MLHTSRPRAQQSLHCAPSLHCPPLASYAKGIHNSRITFRCLVETLSQYRVGRSYPAMHPLRGSTHPTPPYCIFHCCMPSPCPHAIPLPSRHRPPLMPSPSHAIMATPFPRVIAPPLKASPSPHGMALPSMHGPPLMASPSPHAIPLPSWHGPPLVASPFPHVKVLG